MVDDLTGYGAQQPALESRMASVSDHYVIDVVLFGISHNLLRWATD